MQVIYTKQLELDIASACTMRLNYQPQNRKQFREKYNKGNQKFTKSHFSILDKAQQYSGFIVRFLNNNLGCKSSIRHESVLVIW